MVGSLEPRGDTAVALLLFSYFPHHCSYKERKKNLLSVNLCFQFVQASEEKEKKVAEKEILN